MSGLDLWRLILTRGVTLCALVALAVSSEAGRWVALAGGVGVALAWALHPRPHRPWLWSALTTCVAVLTAITPPLGVVPWRWGGAGLVLYLMVHRARVGRAPSDDRLSLLFALLVILLASANARSLALAPVLVAVVVSTPLVLTLSRLAEMERAGAVRRRPLHGEGRWGALVAMGGACLALTALFFFTLPRINAQAMASLSEGASVAGYGGEEVTLGAMGVDKDNPTLVMRAEVFDASGERQRGPFYFRGAALDAFDGQRWWASEDLKQAGRRRVRGGYEPARTPPGQLRQVLLVEPLEGAPVFGIPSVDRLFSEDAVDRDALGALWTEGPARPRRVVVYSDQGGPGAAALPYASRVLPPASLTGLPADLDPRVMDLVDGLVDGDDTRAERAADLVRALQEGFTYTLVPPPDLGRQSLSDFLFVSKSGHCEYYATALAVMLRAAGVPAVLALGFYGGEWNEVGGYLAVRQSHAHAWVEAELEPGQWVRLDATPSGDFAGEAGGLVGQLGDVLRARWQLWVIDYDLDQQLSAAQALGAALSPGSSGAGPALPMGPVLMAAALLAVAAGARRARSWAGGERARRRGPVARVHEQARALVRRRGWRVPPSLPPVQAAEWLCEALGEDARPLHELAWIHYEVRYGSALESDALPRARACLKALRALPRSTR